MKDFIKNKKVQLSLLCIVLVVCSFLVGKHFNNTKTIPVLKDGTEVIAKVDGKDFSITELYEELKEKNGSVALTSIVDSYIASKELKDTTEASEYADSYVANLKAQYEYYKKDLEAELKQYGYKGLDQFRETVYKDRVNQLVAEKYIKNTEYGFITESEINDYYKENITGAMTARYILIAPEEVDTNDENYTTKKEESEAKALAEANEVIEKLKKGEKFEDLAKKHSDDKTTAAEGGLFSGFSKKDVVSEFWDASVALEDGKYTTEPVKSSYGYFVILRVKQDKKPSLEDSREECLKSLLSEKVSNDSEIYDKAWKKIRKAYNLEIIDTELEKAYNEK